MKTKILMAILVSLLVILVVSPGIPAGNKAAERGQGTGGKDAKGPPEIEVVTFVNTPYWTSPPWYPDECEDTDTYRLVRGGIRWASDALPVNCVVYTLGAPGGAFDAVAPAFGVWDGYTLATIYGTVEEDSETTTPPGLAVDESNTVFWGHIDGPGGVIAMTQFVFWSNTKELIEFDIIFDHDEVWLATNNPLTLPTSSEPGNPYPATGQFDVWNVATHELGHTLILDDLRSPRDGALTMHAYTWPGDSTKRDLGSGDIQGIQAIYGE